MYLGRDGHLTQLTQDHSLVNELYRMGKITREEMRKHPLRNSITRTIGTNQVVAPCLWQSDVLLGDIFLLCSDGFTIMLDQNELIRTFKRITNVTDLAQTSVKQANEAGGRDNITVVLLSVQ